MAHFYLNSYAPLVFNTTGRVAASNHQILPFVDGSIRREPDLEHAYPSISCLCRTDKFAPRLKPGDFVAYMAKKSKYGPLKKPHYRLTAVLHVHEILESHPAAMEWYQSRGLPLPNNCMVRGNNAMPLEQSHRISDTDPTLSESKTHRAWDASYRARAMQYRTFVVCKPLWIDLSWSAPIIEDDDLLAAFGEIPATLNPGRRTIEQLKQLLEVLELDVPLSDL